MTLHTKSIAHINSQQLWLSAQDLRKSNPAKIPWYGKKHMGVEGILFDHEIIRQQKN